MAQLSNGRIVKIGIVTPDAARSAALLRAIFPAVAAPATHESPPFTVEPYREYHGRRVTDVELRVENVYTENFWFELIEPVGDAPSPWRDHLDEHGTSVCFTSVYVDSGFEEESRALEEQGCPRVWVEDKGFERYAYFDTTDLLGFLVEVKERAAR